MPRRKWEELRYFGFFQQCKNECKEKGIPFGLTYMRKEYCSILRHAYRDLGTDKIVEMMTTLGVKYRRHKKIISNNESLGILEDVIQKERYNWSEFKLNIASLMLEERYDEIISLGVAHGLKADENMIRRILHWLISDTDSHVCRFLERYSELSKIFSDGPNHKAHLTEELIQLHCKGTSITKIANDYGIFPVWVKALLSEARMEVMDFYRRCSESLYQDYTNMHKMLLDNSGKHFTTREEDFLKARVVEEMNQKQAAKKLGLTITESSVIELALVNRLVNSLNRSLDQKYLDFLQIFALYTDAVNRGIIKDQINSAERKVAELIASGMSLSRIKKLKIIGLLQPANPRYRASAKMRKALKEARIEISDQAIKDSRVELTWPYGKIKTIMRKIMPK